ncbi:MAG: sigma-70 family RNA polymerase sigma factor [Geovibrio sp.]|jgi:RNA polymerase sigma-70 factor (ECF subfamily)|uniref:sigma-70 family RNA polymerase sigma factor n=1 Tax=Geovibrio ferrireducens TaxID=46201 RepID=UPI002247244D|nr:sigma-70 family RNA polymerase sigma factor [Geovibrio ferrireducens]MCD8492842.1 sigma-70 family RNA polymerase sigma factor [Geovibrio sp.]MCD8569250.1 sigma-70 family RNA polymerase sigma factor [Geovibrio sp.]
MGDALVVEKVIDGDAASYELLIRKYQSKLFSTVLHMVKNRELAEDIVQESFLRAFRKLDTLNNRSQFYPWIKRIALNMALNHFEKEKRVLDVETEDDESSFFENISSGESPEELTLKEEMKRYVRMFVDSLPDRLRVVIILREVEDMSYEEIAEMLNIPLGTVRSRLFNARNIIKERLIKQGLADGLYKTS